MWLYAQSPRICENSCNVTVTWGEFGRAEPGCAPRRGAIRADRAVPARQIARTGSRDQPGRAADPRRAALPRDQWRSRKALDLLQRPPVRVVPTPSPTNPTEGDFKLYGVARDVRPRRTRVLRRGARERQPAGGRTPTTTCSRSPSPRSAGTATRAVQHDIRVWRPTASGAARSNGRVIIASWPEAKSTTSHPAVSRKRWRSRRSSPSSGPRCSGCQSRPEAPIDTKARVTSAAAAVSRSPTQSRARRHRTPRPAATAPVRRPRTPRDLAPLRPQQVEQRLAVVGNERRTSSLTVADPRCGCPTSAARRRSSLSTTSQVGSTGSGVLDVQREVGCGARPDRAAQRRDMDVVASGAQLDGHVAPAPAAVPGPVDQPGRLQSASCWYAIDWNDIRCSGETPASRSPRGARAWSSRRARRTPSPDSAPPSAA